MTIVARKQHIYAVNKALVAHHFEDANELRRYASQLTDYNSEYPLLNGYSLFVHAMLARLDGDDARCAELLRGALQQLNDVDNNHAKAEMLLCLSYISLDSTEGISLTKMARDIFGRNNDDIGVSKALSNLGVFYKDTQEYGSSYDAFLSAIDLQRKTKDIVGMSIAMLNLSATCRLNGDYARALFYARESIANIEACQRELASDNQSGGAFVWQTNGWVLVPTKCDGYLANAYINYGNALDALGETDKAAEAYIGALGMMRSAEDVRGEALTLNQLGEVFREKGEYATAEEYYTRSKLLFEQSGTRGYMYAVSLQSIGEASAAQRKFDQAGEYYRAALDEFKNVNYIAGEAEVLVLLGELSSMRGSHRKAITYVTRGLEIAQGISLVHVIVRGDLALGTATMHIDSAKAKEHFSRALLLAEDKGMKLEQQNIHNQLSSLHKMLGDSAQALFHFERFHVLTAELFSEAADRRLKNLHILHDIEKYKQSLAEKESKVLALESELESKSRELVSLASRIVEKQEFMDLMVRGLNKIIAASSDDTNKYAEELLSLVQSGNTVTRDWEEFTKMFMTVHHQFAVRLLELAPGIRPAELRVSVLVLLSMNAKQIAEVLKISPKVVETHKLHVRQRLGLQARENLYTYLLQLDIAGASGAPRVES